MFWTVDRAISGSCLHVRGLGVVGLGGSAAARTFRRARTRSSSATSGPGTRRSDPSPGAPARSSQRTAPVLRAPGPRIRPRGGRGPRSRLPRVEKRSAPNTAGHDRADTLGPNVIQDRDGAGASETRERAGHPSVVGASRAPPCWRQGAQDTGEIVHASRPRPAGDRAPPSRRWGARR